MSNISDEDCLYNLQQGNADALEYLIRIYFPVLCAYAERITNRRADAEDITEEVFIKVWDRRGSFKAFGELKGFLYTAIRNASLNVVRSRRREKLRNKEFLQLEQATGYEDFLYEEMLVEIRKSMESLPHKMREIFILSYYKKMSNEEIASHLKLSCQTVRNQKTKALSLLRLMLKDKQFALFLFLFP